jgi:TonB family protein
MNRLQKKCFIVSAGMHLLLGLIFLSSSAFISSKPAQDVGPVLDFTPIKTTDLAVAPSGGTPNAGASRAAQPTEPEPPPAASQRPSPEPPQSNPPKQTNREIETTSEPSFTESRRQVHHVEVSTTPVTRKQNSKSSNNEQKAREQAKQQAYERQQIADALTRAENRIGSEVSGGVTIGLRGPGGGSVTYANFNQAVMSVYKRAWAGTVPNDATEQDVGAEASVTIARDGSVISAYITRSSGRPAVDRSVQSVLDRVRYAAPLPEDAREDKRTVSITFDVTPKQ